MSKNDQQVPKFEDDTDLLINQLKSEIKSLQSQNSTSQDKLIEGISKVEEQLNIQSPENSRIYNLDPMDRILRVGSNIKSLHSQILNQIFDIFSRGLYDIDFLEDTLTTIKEELEGSAIIQLDDFETQEALQNLRQIALDETPEIEKLREALKQSLMIHQDSECKIRSLRARISNLEHQITFYIESNQNPGKNPENLSFNSDDENSELSPFNLDVHSNSLQLDSMPRTINRNRNRAASVRSKKFHKPHNSINPNTNESVDQYALSKIQQQKLESSYKDQIFQLNSKITQYKAQIDLEKQGMIKIKVKYDKLAQNYKLVSRKLQKSQEINKQCKDKIKELEEANAKLRKPEEELQEKVKALKEQLSNFQAKSAKDEQMLNKYKSALAVLKKKFDQLKQKSDSIEKQFSIVEKTVLQNGGNQDEKIEGQTQADKIINCFNQLEEQNKNLINSNQSQKNQLESHISYFSNIRQSLGLPNESSNLQDQTNSEVLFNKEIVDQVNKINKEVEDYKSQLKQVQTTLGMSEISSNNKEESIIDKIKSYQNENEQIKSQLSKLRKTLGLSDKGSGTENEINEIIQQTENATKENQQLKDQISQMKKAMGIEDTGSKEKQNGNSIVDQIINTNNELKQMKEVLREIANNLGVSTKSFDNNPSPSASKQFYSEIIKALQNQIKENNDIRESLGLDKSNKKPTDSIEMVKNQKEENAILKKHVQNVLSELGLPPINGKEPAAIESKCSTIEAEIKKMKDNREKLQEEMNSLKKSLGLENEQGENKGVDLTSKVNSINAENSQLKEQIQKMTTENSELKEQIQKTTTENAESKEQIQKMTTENVKLKEQISEMCEMLGIPNVTERSIDLEHGNVNSTLMSQNINSIKNKLNELQTEKDNMKQQIESLEKNKTELETLNNQQKEEMRTLKRALGIEDNENKENLNKSDQNSTLNALNKIQVTTQENTNMKEQLNKLRELLGLPKTDDQTNSEEIFTKLETLQREKENLQNRTEEQNQEMLSLKQALGIEDENAEQNQNSNKPKTQNMIDQIHTMNKENAELKEKIKKMRESLGLPSSEDGSDDKNMFDRIDEVNSENSILKKQVQEMCKMLGISDLTKEVGEGNTMKQQLEEASNEIKNKLNDLQTENEIMKQQIINLSDTLHIDNQEFKESQNKHNKEEILNKINTEIINRIETLEKTKTELETLNNQQKEEMRTLKRALGIEDNENKENMNKSDQNSTLNALNKIQVTTQENTNMKEQLNKLRELLGLPQTDDQTNSEEIFTKLETLQREKENLQNRTEEQNQEMLSLKQALGIEDGNNQSNDGNVLKVVQNTTQENAELKEQIQKMTTENSELKEQIQKTTTENAELKEQIQKMTTENVKLKEQISEMCEMLGIPNVTERSIDLEHGNVNATLMSQNINSIKNKLNELQTEKDNMKQQIINLADTLHIDSQQLKESHDKQSNEESINKIITQIKELYKHKQILNQQQDSIRTTLGFPPITNEDLSKAENGTKDPLLAYIENMKSILISLSNTLGTDPNDLISDSILEKLKEIKKDNQLLKDKNDQQKNEMKTIKKALGIEEGNENVNENELDQSANVLKNIQNTTQENTELKNQIDKLREILGLPKTDDKIDGNSLIERIDEVNSENSILKKQVQEMCKMLGISDLTKEVGEGNTMKQQLEEASNEIKNKLNDLQTENEIMKQQIINLSDTLHIDNQEFKESQNKHNKEEIINKINTEIINRIETLEKTKTELETLNNQQKEEMRALKRALGIEDNDTNDENNKQKSNVQQNSTLNALNKIQVTTQENTNMKEQLNKLRELLGLPKTDDHSNSEVIQKVGGIKNENSELHKMIEDQNSSIQIQKDEINEIESLLQDEFEQDKEDKSKHSKSKIVRAIKRIKKNNKQLKNQLETTINQCEQEKQNLAKKLADKKKEIEELKHHNIEIQSKASGMMEERSSIYNKIQSLQDSIVDVIKAPDSPKSPVYQKLNGISQEISNQQSMIGELAQDKERLKKLEKFEEERNQIIDNLLSNGLLTVQERKEVDLNQKIGEILHERKEIMINSDSSKKLEKELLNKQEQLNSIKKALGLPVDESEIKEEQIISSIKEMNNKNENLQNQVKTIKQALGLPQDENQNEKQTNVTELVSNLRSQVNDFQKERKAILSSLGISESLHSSSETILTQIEKIKNENKNLNKEHTEIVNSLSSFGDSQDHNDVVQSLRNLAQERQTITRTIFSQDDTKITSKSSRSSPMKETNLSLKKSKSSVLFKTTSEVIQGLERIVNDAHNGAGNKEQLKIFESKLDRICTEFGCKENLQFVSIDKKFENLQKIMKSKFEEVAELKNHLEDYKNTIKRVQKLLGVEDGNNSNAAAELEAKLISFITKTEEEKENKTSELENKISELQKKIDFLSSMLDKLKKERINALTILGVDDENIKNDLEFEEDESPLIEAIQKVLSERKELADQIDKLKEHLTTAAGTIQSLAGERNSIMQALMPGGGHTLFDKQVEHTTNVLFKNLESLGIQISRQNDSMNSVIGESPREISESSSSPIPRLKKRERPLRPQSHIVAALNTIRSQLENAQKETADKEIKIAELEDEIDKLKKK